MEASDDSSCLQVIILDTDTLHWGLRNKLASERIIDVSSMIRCIIMFCNSYTAMNRQNRLCVISQNKTNVKVLYPRRNSFHYDSFIPSSEFYSILTSQILQEINLPPTNISSSTPSDTGTLSQALSKALCIINRQLQCIPGLLGKIFVLQLTKDNHMHYNAMMNSIFSAQKLGILVDAIMLGKHDSSFLQQACHLTDGLYLRPSDYSIEREREGEKELLQLLLTFILPDSSVRKLLRLPKQSSVDFRASCFCHGQATEFVHMCSVCLALTCTAPLSLSLSSGEKCDTCGTPAK